MYGPNGIADAEQIMPTVMLRLFPPVIAALFIVSAIAAMLSTADAMLLVTASEFTENILKPVFMKDKELSHKKALAISRFTMFVVCVCATALAFVLPSKMVYNIVAFAWAGLGNPFAVVTCASLFWKKFNGTAALWTMIIGFLGTICWYLSPLQAHIDCRLGGVFPAIIAAYVVTQMTKDNKEA